MQNHEPDKTMGKTYSCEQSNYSLVSTPRDSTEHLRVQASSDKKQLDVGANLFIGNLDDNVDERLLYDTFSAFGVMSTTAKVNTIPLRLVGSLAACFFFV